MGPTGDDAGAGDAGAVETAVGDVDTLVREGDVGPLHDWMGERVHRHGRRYTTPDLVHEATGEEYTADHFVDYVTAKYGGLYEF